DDTIERLTGDPRPVSSLRTSDLAGLFAAHGGLLTVADALDAFPESRFNIDGETNAAAAPIGSVPARPAQRRLVASFSERNRRAVLASIQQAGAAIPPATSAGRRTILALRTLSPVRLSPARLLRDIDAVQIPEHHAGIRVLTPGLLRAAHSLGVEVHVWTVNEPETMQRLVDAGVDGIVTDRADLALKAV